MSSIKGNSKTRYCSIVDDIRNTVDSQTENPQSFNTLKEEEKTYSTSREAKCDESKSATQHNNEIDLPKVSAGYPGFANCETNRVTDRFRVVTQQLCLRSDDNLAKSRKPRNVPINNNKPIKINKKNRASPKAMERFWQLKNKMEESARQLALKKGRPYVTEVVCGENNRFVDAALNGDLEKVKKSVHLGLDVEWQHSVLGYTPLMAAVFYAGHDGGWFILDVGQTEVVQFLIENGANVNATSKRTGETALHMAAANGRSDIVQYLLDSGANKLIKDNSGLIPLDRATEFCGKMSKPSMMLRDLPLEPDGRHCVNLYKIANDKREEMLLVHSMALTDETNTSNIDTDEIKKKVKELEISSGGLSRSYHPFELWFRWRHCSNADQYLAPVLAYQLRWRPSEFETFEDMNSSIYGKSWLLGYNHIWPPIQQGWKPIDHDESENKLMSNNKRFHTPDAISANSETLLQNATVDDVRHIDKGNHQNIESRPATGYSTLSDTTVEFSDLADIWKEKRKSDFVDDGSSRINHLSKPNDYGENTDNDMNYSNDDMEGDRLAELMGVHKEIEHLQQRAISRAKSHRSLSERLSPTHQKILKDDQSTQSSFMINRPLSSRQREEKFNDLLQRRGIFFDEGDNFFTAISRDENKMLENVVSNDERTISVRKHFPRRDKVKNSSDLFTESQKIKRKEALLAWRQLPVVKRNTASTCENENESSLLPTQILGDLIPALNYQIQIRAKNVKGWGKWGPIGVVSTGNYRADPPAIPCKSRRSSTSITIKWRSSRGNGLRILAYQVSYRYFSAVTQMTSFKRPRSVRLENKRRKELGLPNLSGGSNILALSRRLNVGTKRPSTMGSSGIEEAESFWLAGRVFNVEEDKSKLSTESNGCQHEWTISDLEPSSEYVFRVRAQNKIGWSEYGPASVKIWTDDGPTMKASTPFSILLEWPLPDIGAEEIEYFEVQVSRIGDTDNPQPGLNDGEHGPWETVTSVATERRHNVLKLLPFRLYVFRTRTKVRGEPWPEYSITAKSKVLRTAAHVTETPLPVMVSLPSNEENDNKVKVQWQHPHWNGGDIIDFEIQGLVHGRIGGDGNGNEGISLGESDKRIPTNDSKNPDHVAAVVDRQGLENPWFIVAICGWDFVDTYVPTLPGTRYTYRIRCRNEIGWSCFSDVSNSIKTEATIPCTPSWINMLNTTSSDMKIEWEQPHHQGERISGYEFQCMSLQGSWNKFNGVHAHYKKLDMRRWRYKAKLLSQIFDIARERTGRTMKKKIHATLLVHALLAPTNFFRQFTRTNVAQFGEHTPSVTRKKVKRPNYSSMQANETDPEVKTDVRNFFPNVPKSIKINCLKVLQGITNKGIDPNGRYGPSLLDLFFPYDNSKKAIIGALRERSLIEHNHRHDAFGRRNNLTKREFVELSKSVVMGTVPIQTEITANKQDTRRWISKKRALTLAFKRVAEQRLQMKGCQSSMFTIKVPLLVLHSALSGHGYRQGMLIYLFPYRNDSQKILDKLIQQKNSEKIGINEFISISRSALCEDCGICESDSDIPRKSKIETISVTDSKAEVSVLPSCNYRFRVRSRNIKGLSKWSLPSDVYHTLSEKPSNIKRPQLLDSSSNVIRVWWCEPICNGSPIDRYRIQRKLVKLPLGCTTTHPWIRDELFRGWVTLDSFVNADTLRPTFSLQNVVLPGTSWVFRVAAHNKNGWTKWSSKSRAFVSTSTTPIPPGSLSTRELNNECVISSRAMRCTDFGRDFICLETTFVYPNGRPIIRYEIQGKDVSRTMQSIQIMCGKKGSAAVKAALILQKHYRSRLKTRGLLSEKQLARMKNGWETYLLDNCPEKKLRCEFVRNTSISIPPLVWRISNLEGGTSHIFRIRCQTELGWSDYSPVSDVVQLLNSVPSKPIAPIMLSTESFAVSVEWFPPFDNGSDIDKYELQYRASGEKRYIQLEERHESVTTEWVTVSAVIKFNPKDGGDPRDRIVGLVPDSLYQFRVRAHNVLGWGAFSRASESMLTNPAVPTAGPPPWARHRGSAALHLQWLSPDPRGAKVVEYDLQIIDWGEFGPPPVRLYGVAEWPRESGKKFFGIEESTWTTVSDVLQEVNDGDEIYIDDTKRFTMPHLKPSRFYQFRIRAKNRKGWGEYSPPSDIMRVRRHN